MRCLLLYTFYFVCATLLAKSFDTYPNAPFVHAIYNTDELAYQSIDSVEMSTHSRAFFDTYHLFWLAIAMDDNLKMEQAQDRISLVDLASVEDSTLQVSLALLKMRIALINGNYLIAVQATSIIRHYFSTPEKVTEPYDLFLRGMYHYFVAYGRKESLFYRLYLVGWPKADASKGLAYLKAMVDSKVGMVANEASYFLGRIYLEYEDEKQLAQPLFELLHEKYPNNSIYTDFLKQCK